MTSSKPEASVIVPEPIPNSSNKSETAQAVYKFITNISVNPIKLFLAILLALSLYPFCE